MHYISMGRGSESGPIIGHVVKHQCAKRIARMCPVFVWIRFVLVFYTTHMTLVEGMVVFMWVRYSDDFVRTLR